MDKALNFMLSNPKLLKKNPEVINTLINSADYKVIQQLASNGEVCVIGDNPLPGVTLNFDSIDAVKNYKSQVEYGYMCHDVKIPGSAPVSQLLHNEEGSRVLVPYANLNQTPEQRQEHITRIKESMIRVCQRLGHPITDANIIINYDEQGNAILQINNKHVENLKNNKEFTDLVGKDIKDCYDDAVLGAVIDSGYKIFRYNDSYQKYPLLQETPEHTHGLLHKLIRDPQVQPIIINVTNNYHIQGNNNSMQVNSNNDNSQHINITTIDASTKFINYIKTQKPEWYKENSWMDRLVLKEKYAEITGEKISDKSLHKILKNKIARGFDRKQIGNIKKQLVWVKPFNSM